MTNAASSIVAKDITVSYYSGGTRNVVFNDLSFAPEPKKFSAILGPSGCGKSTLLNTIGGFIKVERGLVQLNGERITKPSSNIGYISQSSSLFEWRTVKKNIAFGLQFQDLSKEQVDAKVNAILEMIGLIKQRNYYPAQLSGGMQQRVALARSIVLNPSVLLLDEPFSALDRDNRERMHELLLKYWEEKKPTIVFVTHDIEEAILLSDKIYLVQKETSLFEEIDVLFPRPRQSSLALSDEFQHLKQQILTFYKSIS